tara:strand:- start:546 stop:716 length:171 start_codon:yes stop_codon:yes gene_type:complete
MKRKLLSGNYNPEKNPEISLYDNKSTKGFEQSAIEKLGGSIAFVRGGKLYDENNDQ